MSTNDITGDKIQTKNVSESYRNNFDTIFRKVKEPVLESYHQYMMKEENEIKKSTD